MDDDVGVNVAVGVALAVGVAVGMSVDVAVGVGVGVSVGLVRLIVMRRRISALPLLVLKTFNRMVTVPL